MNAGAVGDASLAENIGKWSWPKLSLAWQFTIVSSAVVVVGMLVQGFWVASKIKQSVIVDTATSAALYMDSFIAPHLQELQPGSMPTPRIEHEIDEVMQTASMRMRVFSIKIWTPDGLILYSSHKPLTGKRFAPKEDLIHAAKGNVSVDFDDLDDDENVFERSSGVPLVEIYAPVRDDKGAVIAVAEFYERAEALGQTLAAARRQSWLVTGSVCSLMITGLFLIVARGSHTIEEQKRALSDRVAQLTQLLSQNEHLRRRVQKASQLATEDNERFLRRLGSDIHDGPAQLISLSLLRLDGLSPDTQIPGAMDDKESIRAALTDAMNDIRNICAGLCLPEIESLSLKDALLFAIRDHERRTRTCVSLDISELPIQVPHFAKISLCRFIQEGLNNAFRHAGGIGQHVSARADGQAIVVEVGDNGPGIRRQSEAGDRVRLGLVGLWDRIESLGGVLEVHSQPGVGTRLVARLPLPLGGEKQWFASQ